MASSYGQFCPVAKAMEVLDERWTLLVVRELLAGSSRFNEIRRGVPRMSPALLSKRLRTLERVGVVRRSTSGRTTSYTLTESGQDLARVVEALGLWGMRWVGDLGEDDYDPHLLFWDVQRTIPVDAWPRRRTVVRFVFDDVAARVSRWWIVVDGDDIDVCDADPGHDVTASVHTGLRVLTRIWRGERPWPDAIRSGAVRIEAAPDVARVLPGWFGDSAAAQLLRMQTPAAS